LFDGVIERVMSKPNRSSEMEKLINKFRAEPTAANRAKLDAYLKKHSMALCMATPEEVAFLRGNGFNA
jgi:hypothetical protein